MKEMAVKVEFGDDEEGKYLTIYQVGKEFKALKKE